MEPLPPFWKFKGGGEIFSFFDDSCTPNASINALRGGGGPQLQQWLHRSQQNTGTPPHFYAKSGLFWPVYALKMQISAYMFQNDLEK